MEAKKRLAEYISDHREEGFSFLKQFVRFQSISGNEKEAQLFLSDIFSGLGASIDLWEPEYSELKEHPAFLSPRESFAGSPNLAGVIKGLGGGRSLILNSHVDVVPIGKGDWTLDPWEGIQREGRIYGRGTSDMKGGMAAMILALKALKALKIPLRGDIILQSVIEEEAGGAGTLACIVRGYKADGAVIPEPTDLLLYPAAMGSMWFRITIKGKAAHGATSYLGINPLEKAGHLIETLKKLEEKRTKQNHHPLYTHLPVPFCINIGTFKGGNWPSSVPEEAVMEGRMGVSPRETVEEARKELEKAIRAFSKKDPWLSEHPPKVEWFGSCWVSGEIAVDHPLLTILAENIKPLQGEDPRILGAPWATDAALLIRYADTPAVIFGPGTGSKAHQADEYIEEEKLIKAAQILAGFILDWCG